MIKELILNDGEVIEVADNGDIYHKGYRMKPYAYNAGEDNLVFVLRSLADWWNAPYKGVE